MGGRASAMSAEPERESRMGPRCEWCEQSFRDGQAHHERMDCIRVLRGLLRGLREQLRKLQEERCEWVLTHQGTAQLKRLGWTPPNHWWTYGPQERPAGARGGAPCQVTEEWLSQAGDARPADVYRLLIELRDLRAKVSLQATLDPHAEETYGRLFPIANAAWECLHAADPAARVRAADRLAKALTEWRAAKRSVNSTPE